VLAAKKGYIILAFNCPVLCRSKLQTEIALRFLAPKICTGIGSSFGMFIGFCMEITCFVRFIHKIIIYAESFEYYNQQAIVSLDYPHRQSLYLKVRSASAGLLSVHGSLLRKDGRNQKSRS
jgi:hypothetical protein